MPYIAWLRSLVGHRKILLVTASAVIRDASGGVLLQRRADFGDDWWGLPGGALEPGETIGACIRREVQEETGLHVEPLRLTGVYTGPRYEVTYPNGDLVQQVTACFECRIVAGSPRADGHEIRSLAFFAPGAMPHIPLWYADMIRHALDAEAPTFFEPPHPPPASNLQSADALSSESPAGNHLADLRRLVGPALLVAPGCAALVQDQAGRVLLQLRADFRRWGLPGGAMDLGETAADTVIRETREETGLAVEPLRLLDVQSGGEVAFPNGDRLSVFGMLFACRVVGGLPRPDGGESLEVGFFPPDDLPPLASPRLAARLARAIANRGPGATFD